jgi:hypothetical protein
MAPDRVAHPRAITKNGLPKADQHLRRLPPGALDRHKAHGRSAHGLADRFGVGRVVLPPLQIRLHILRWQKNHLVAQRFQLPSPVVGRPASFHADPRRLELGEEHHHLGPPQLLAQHRLLGLIQPMQLKNTLGRVHANSDKLRHGRLPWLRLQRPSIWHTRCRRGPSTPTRKTRDCARSATCFLLGVLALKKAPTPRDIGAVISQRRLKGDDRVGRPTSTPAASR